MKFDDTSILRLRSAVGELISKERYHHTLGVEKAATQIAEKCLPDKIYQIRVAALLHDISKEYSVAEQLDFIKTAEVPCTEDDLMSPPVFHSLTAPVIIRRDFSEYADDDVLSAVLYHTTGAPNMSIFDEIIFVADYVEDGRRYHECQSVRRELFDRLYVSRGVEECISVLHKATVSTLNNTIVRVVNSGKFLHPKTILTRNAFLVKRYAR